MTLKGSGPTIRQVWVALTIAAAFMGPASTPIGIPDVLWSLMRGRWSVSHAALLDQDPFTSAPHIPGPLVNVQWLADLLFYGLYSLGGLPLIITGTAAIVALTYAILLAAAFIASGHLRVSCIAMWLAYALAASNLSGRPQTLSYPIFALFVLAVVRSEWRQDTRLLWLLPPATAVWVNIHGSFFTGFVLLGCAALGRMLAPLEERPRSGSAARPEDDCGVASVQTAPGSLECRFGRWTSGIQGRPWLLASGQTARGRIERGFETWSSAIRERLLPAQAYLLALGACLLASLLNPYGLGALVSILSISTNPIIRDYVTEWAPTTVSWHEGIMFFASVAMLGALMLTSRLRLTAVELVTLVVFGYLAWSSVRVVVWWSLVIGPILARLIGSVLPHRPRLTAHRDRPVVNAVFITGVLVIAAFSLPWTKTAVPILPPAKRTILAEETPLGLGNYLQTHDPPASGRMLNSQEWGGYLEWAAWPRHQVFLDGRIELHPAQVWLDYLEIVFPSTRWRALLDKYDIQYAVLTNDDNPDLIAYLRLEPDWRVDYQDAQGVVFTRVAPSAGV